MNNHSQKWGILYIYIHKIVIECGIMEKDTKQDYNEEMQEVMLELKLKTDNFMKKLKKQNKMTRLDTSGM